MCVYVCVHTLGANLLVVGLVKHYLLVMGLHPSIEDQAGSGAKILSMHTPCAFTWHKTELGSDCMVAGCIQPLSTLSPSHLIVTSLDMIP